jgi:hypothetical protein
MGVYLALISAISKGFNLVMKRRPDSFILAFLERNFEVK